MGNRSVVRGALIALVVAVQFATVPSVRALDSRRPLATYAVDSWNDGLPQQMVQDILQGSDGALWLATFEGIVRFNGAEMLVLDRRSHPEVGEWRVRTLAEGSRGDLWAGTVGGGVLLYRDGKFRRFTTADGLPSNKVIAIVRSRDGSLWLGTSAGLARLAGQRFERVGAIAPSIESMREASDGSLIVGAADGLYRVMHGQFSRIALPLESGQQPYVFSVAVMRNGDIWAGTRSEGVFRIRGSVVTRFATIADAVSPWVSFITEDRDGSIWFGLAPGGLARFSSERFEVLRQSNGLPSASVKCGIEDREGSLWVGTNGGLARIRDLKFFSYSMRNGLSDDYVRVVTPAADGGIWVGTYGGGVNHLSDDGVTKVIADRELADPYVRTIAEEPGGALWVGTGSGLNVIRGGVSHPVVERIGASHGFTGKKVNAILVRRDRSVIVASDEQPLQVAVNGRFAALAIDRVREAGNARVLAEGREGDLWIGTESFGLLRVRGGETIAAWTKDGGLPSNAVFSLHEASNGDVWVGTHGGFALLHNGKVTTFGGGEGLPDEAIFQILTDRAGYFWLTTNHGVIRVSRKVLDDFAAGRARKIEFEIFGRRDGMPSEQCNGATQPAGARLPDGRLAIPTVAGLAIVDPGSLRRNRIAPVAKLTRVLVDGRTVDRAKPAALPWSTDRFEFHYEGLSLLQPELVTFRYRIDGYDREWVDAGTRRFALYNSLPPGPHTFRVQARNNDGVWSKSEATYDFELATPPWRRWWAILAYLALAALIISIVTRWRLRSLRRTNELLESKVRERTVELELANTRLTETSRELEAVNRRLAEMSETDPLTHIANRRRFDQVLQTEWRRALRTGTELAVVIIDVDHFKAYNDHYGHQRGDDCLRQVAHSLEASFGRASDVVARYGGEEFAALLPANSLQEAAQQAERVREAVERMRIPHDASPTARVVTISLGVAAGVPRNLVDAEELIAIADAALYRAKDGGRNRVVAQPVLPVEPNVADRV